MSLPVNKDDASTGSDMSSGYYAWERRAVRDMCDDGLGPGEETSEAGEEAQQQHQCSMFIRGA